MSDHCTRHSAGSDFQRVTGQYSVIWDRKGIRAVATFCRVLLVFDARFERRSAEGIPAVRCLLGASPSAPSASGILEADGVLEISASIPNRFSSLRSVYLARSPDEQASRRRMRSCAPTWLSGSGIPFLGMAQSARGFRSAFRSKSHCLRSSEKPSADIKQRTPQDWNGRRIVTGIACLEFFMLTCNAIFPLELFRV